MAVPKRSEEKSLIQFLPGRKQPARACVTLTMAAVLIGVSTAVAQTILITTVAGNGVAGYDSDGLLATASALNYPRGVTIDASGNIYIADEQNNRVRRVSSTGTITTFAGTGLGGFSGDGGLASNAQLNQPQDVFLDTSGNIYIADSGNQRIRKVTPAGIISTVAGTGAFGFNGDNIPAVSAQLNRPTAIVLDFSGNLYIADSSNHRIRKVAANGIITTVAGNGIPAYSNTAVPATSASLSFPTGVSLDNAGNLYIADAGNQVVRRVAGGIISTVAGNGQGAGSDQGSFSGDGGMATSAGLNFPEGIAVDSSGNLYIADTANNRIRKVSGGVITTIAGTGTDGFSGDGGAAIQAMLNQPSAVSLDSSGNLLIGDSQNNRIRKIALGSGTTAQGNTYYFSHLVLGDVWQTTITYINYSPQTVTCQTTFYSDSGGPLLVTFGGAAVTSRTDTLPAGGSMHAQSNLALNTPLVQGWAQAQCSGLIKASILFRSFQQGFALEAGVNAMTSPTTKFVTFAETRTGVAYANPSTQPAQVTFTAINSAGVKVASTSLTLQAGAHGSANLGPLLGLSSFSGSIQITSTVPIISLSLNFEAAPSFSSLPPGELDGSTPLATGTNSTPAPIGQPVFTNAYYFSHLVLGDVWQTTITYINYSPQTVTCQTTFYSDSGGPLLVTFGGAAVTSRTDTLPAGGSMHAQSNLALNTPLVQGWAQAQCSGPIKASILFRSFQQGFALEAGVNAMTSPTTKFVTFAETRTGVAYANPSTQPAQVTFTAINSVGVKVASTSLTLQAGAHGAANLGPLLGLSSFTGSIQITSTVSIISLSLNFEAAPSFSSLPPGELDGTTPLGP